MNEALTYSEGNELKRFRKWARAQGLSLEEHPHVDFRFLEQRTEDAWRGWQACAISAWLEGRELRAPRRARKARGPR